MSIKFSEKFLLSDSINAKLHNTITFLKDKVNVDSFCELLEFTPKKEFEKLFDYATEDILETLEAYKSVVEGVSQQKIIAAKRYLEKEISAIADSKDSVYAICLAEALGLKRDFVLCERIEESIATKVALLSDDERLLFLKELRKKVLDKYYSMCKLNLLAKLMVEPEHSDVGLLLVKYYAPEEEPDASEVDDDDDDEVNELLAESSEESEETEETEQEENTEEAETETDSEEAEEAEAETESEEAEDETEPETETDSVKAILDSLSLEDLEKIMAAKKAFSEKK